MSVSLNQARLVGSVNPRHGAESVTVTAGGAELVDTATSNLSEAFYFRQVSELGQTGAGAGRK
jgi:hypothetical protein